MNFTHDGHGYFYSGWVDEHKDGKVSVVHLTGFKVCFKIDNFQVDWLEGRNICREYCMDLVSLETPTEDMLIRRLIQKCKLV